MKVKRIVLLVSLIIFTPVAIFTFATIWAIINGDSRTVFHTRAQLGTFFQIFTLYLFLSGLIRTTWKSIRSK